MDQPERMNMIRIDAEVRSKPEQAEAMIGSVDHVEYGADTGLARLHVTTVSADPLLTEMRIALDRVEGVLTQAGLTDIDALNLSIATEELVEHNGAWRRRGELVGPIL